MSRERGEGAIALVLSGHWAARQHTSAIQGTRNTPCSPFCGWSTVTLTVCGGTSCTGHLVCDCSVRLHVLCFCTFVRQPPDGGLRGLVFCCATTGFLMLQTNAQQIIIISHFLYTIFLKQGKEYASAVVLHFQPIYSNLV